MKNDLQDAYHTVATALASEHAEELAAIEREIEIFKAEQVQKGDTEKRASILDRLLKRAV